MRIGHGFDVHAFGGEGPIIIVAYAFLTKKDCWRILMATWRPCVDRCIAWRGGAGGYRQAVPDTDPAFKGADSRELLREAGVVFRRRVIPLATSMSLSSLGTEDVAAHSTNARVYCRRSRCHMDDVNVKATTTEKLGFTDVGKGLPVKRWRYSLRQQNDEFDNLTYLHGKPQGTGLLKAIRKTLWWWKIWALSLMVKVAYSG